LSDYDSSFLVFGLAGLRVHHKIQASPPSKRRKRSNHHG
jgi:hypothetical protein